MDGWGVGTSVKNNPITQAKIPNIKKVEKNYPACSLQASGIAIGLPWNEAGNSEIGHMAIGGGQIIYQYLPRISMEIKNGKFFNNLALLKTIEHIRKNNSALHLIGLISSGNVHSYLEHIYGLMELARQKNVERLFLHLFTDGKDAPLKEGAKILSKLQQTLRNPEWKIATVIGRFFAMDRNQNWERTEKTYNLLTQGLGEKTLNAIEKLEDCYKQGLTDTYIGPITIINEFNEPVGLIKNDDAVIFFNFREDSARQLTKAFILENFTEFPRQYLNNLFFCSMTQYDKKLSTEVVYPPIEIKNHLTEVLGQNAKKVLKVAETEKYAHVTYFFNGGREGLCPYEDRQLIPTKIVSHYEENPEMQAEKVTDEIIKGLKQNYDLIVANYANPDVIAHTGDIKAAIKAVEIIDKTIKRLIGIAEYDECDLVITSDHGHIEEMVNLQSGEPLTEHTANPVPFYLVKKELKRQEPRTKEEIESLYYEPKGILCDIAPTILELMQIPKPKEMTGTSLLKALKE